MSSTQQQRESSDSSQTVQTETAYRDERPREARPPVDIELAQDLRARQRLPSVEQGSDPVAQLIEDYPDSASINDDKNDEFDKAEGSSIGNREDEQEEKKSEKEGEEGEKEKEEKKVQRDVITGRVLAENRQTCLRCKEKGLRCTLNFVGSNMEPKCAACKRSDTQYCLRRNNNIGTSDKPPFMGLPWKDPDWITGCADRVDRRELEELIKEHYLGRETYRFGEFLYEGEREALALPPFNGSDLPVEERAERWQPMDWMDVLPRREF